MKNNRGWFTIGLVIITVAIMYYIEIYLTPPYFIKSLIKLIIFLGIPISFGLITKNMDHLNYFKIPNIRTLITSITLGLGVYFFIILCYIIFKSFIDLDNISRQLAGNLKINKENFIFVGLYITLVNSFIEEFFFRGFSFLGLRKYLNPNAASLFSAIIFSIYHIAIMGSWFGAGLFMLIITGLIIAGLIFNWLNRSNGNIYSSWLVHLSANLGINTIGLLMFGIIP